MQVRGIFVPYTGGNVRFTLIDPGGADACRPAGAEVCRRQIEPGARPQLR